ncbi:MAG: hypothetical protein R3B06_28585 [Kofleriaceae bacterium]
MTAVLTVQDLHKRFGDRRVLAGASFVVDERDRIGLIGQRRRQIDRCCGWWWPGRGRRGRVRDAASARR